MKKSSAGFTGIYILIGLVILALAGGAYYFLTNKNIASPITPRACTQEAKICPDGSSVGRTGPNCEFSLCPAATPTTTPADISNWKTYKSIQGYEIKYPNDWTITEEMVAQLSKGTIQISIFRNSDVNMDSIDTLKKYYNNQPAQFKVIGDIVIDGHNGFQYDFLTKGERETIIAGDFEGIPKSIYHLFVTYESSQKDEALNTYNQVLSTVKLN